MGVLRRIRRRLADKSVRNTPFYIIRRGELNPVDLFDIYNGCGCFLVSNGPGMAKVDHSILKQPGILTIGVNNGPSVFRPHMWTCVDTPAKFLESIWRDPAILKFVGMHEYDKPNEGHITRRLTDTGWEYYGKKPKDCPNIIYCRRNTHFDAANFFTEPSINYGNEKWSGGARTVMLAAIKTCYVLGIRRLYLNGCDFHMSDKHGYAFNEQRNAGAIRGNNHTYFCAVSYFTQLAPIMKAIGFEIIQCTPDSGLYLFPYMPLDEAVKRELKDFPNVCEEKTFGRYVSNNGVKISDELKVHIKEAYNGNR